MNRTGIHLAKIDWAKKRNAIEAITAVANAQCIWFNFVFLVAEGAKRFRGCRKLWLLFYLGTSLWCLGSHPAWLRLVGISLCAHRSSWAPRQPSHRNKTPCSLTNHRIIAQLKPMGLQRCWSLRRVSQSELECGGVPVWGECCVLCSWRCSRKGRSLSE